NSSTVATNVHFLVTDAPVEPNAANIIGIEGSLFSGIAGTFVDDNPLGLETDFTATIHWGDGASSPGVVTEVFPDLNSVHFNVTGTHTYLDEGHFDASIDLLDSGGTIATINSTATIADAPLTLVTGGASPITT